MQSEFDILQQRWHALRSQVDLIRQYLHDDAEERFADVLEWLYTRLDQIELELGTFAAGEDTGTGDHRDPPRNSAA